MAKKDFFGFGDTAYLEGNRAYQRGEDNSNPYDYDTQFESWCKFDDGWRGAKIGLKCNMETISLPDGYNGDKVKFYLQPLGYEGNTIKLQCAEPGKEYMIKWIDRKTLETAKNS